MRANHHIYILEILGIHSVIPDRRPRLPRLLPTTSFRHNSPTDAMMSPASKFVCKSKLRAGYVSIPNPET